MVDCRTVAVIAFGWARGCREAYGSASGLKKETWIGGYWAPIETTRDRRKDIYQTGKNIGRV